MSLAPGRKDTPDRRLPADAKGQPQNLLLHERLLGERLYLYSLARFLVVAAIVAGSLFASYVVGVEDLDVPKLLAVAAVLALCNCGVFFLVRSGRDGKRRVESRRVLRIITHATIMLDFLFLTIALWLVGGAKSPFQAFYLFNVILASVLLSRTAAFMHTLAGYLFLAALVVGEWLEWIPACYPGGAVSGGGPLDGRYVITLLAVYGLLFALSAAMLTGLMQLLRAGERGIRLTNAKLGHISAMRRDFLHIALHDLKAPVSAVSLQLYAIETELKDFLEMRHKKMFARCQVRLKEQGDFLYDLQILAALDVEGIREQNREVDIGTLVGNVVAENQDLAQERHHTLEAEFPERLPTVSGIERLLRESILNLITNAIKYTPEGGKITVRVMDGGGAVRIQVQDNGIGIAPEDRQRLFKEFVRIRRDDVSVGQQASSGLGLSIVRRVVEAHGGHVEVESAVNKGSTFTIELPADREL